MSVTQSTLCGPNPDLCSKNRRIHVARQMQLHMLQGGSMLASEKISVRSRLGFIGLGYLGSRIARRLVTAGFPMTVYDLNHARAAEFAKLGADVLSNPGSLARQVDVVLRSEERRV